MTRGVQSVARLARNDYVCPSCVLHQHRGVSEQLITASTRRAVHSTLRLRPGPRANAIAPRQTQVPSNDILATRQSRVPRNRRAVSLASSTAINAPAHTPSRYENVHSSFTKLQDDAAAFVDLSRTQLALKGFESDNPTIRVGFLTLGVKGAAAARNLARVLLSDALGDEGQWEQELLQAGADGRSLLLRYGEPDDLAHSNAVMRVISIPSAYLQKHKLEILITPLRTDFTNSTAAEVEDALLVPSLTIPASAGRVGFVRSPVHKSLIIAGGIDGAIQLGRIPVVDDSVLISAVVDIAARGGWDDGTVKTVDTASASEALQKFRVDQSSGGSFGNKWLTSNIPTISAWLTNASETVANANIVEQYAASTLTAVQLSINEAQLVEDGNNESSLVNDEVRDRLQTVIQDWSAEAHNDLRNNLVTALDSRAWRRTAWYRLLWRIDDVSYSSTDILNQCWLNETEQRLAFISGRIREAGLASDEELKENGISVKLITSGIREELATPKSEKLTAAELVQLPTMLTRIHEQSGIDPLFDPPWPQTINLSRQSMLHTSVPAMHRKAQGLVLSTFSTIGGTSALGAWLWVASSGVALYEAGAIAALGLVWSLRRLQRLWGKERDDFSATVQENGRKVLVEIEDQLRRLVRDGGRVIPVAADREGLQRAMLAVENCRQALAALKKS
ncbi:hypothetical protein AMS68_006976 [Peltaster fructicola]|uniref:Mmc1 C-terminal domain-containing protein n=1 Tax=Peltaster fructicola TaxID=286661 RepID=A0A6H0Y3N5_9PEZI|nr:hypothetical protein AMS68_006976 [Peltaster fructicola]